MEIYSDCGIHLIFSKDPWDFLARIIYRYKRYVLIADLNNVDVDDNVFYIMLNHHICDRELVKLSEKSPIIILNKNLKNTNIDLIKSSRSLATNNFKTRYLYKIFPITKQVGIIESKKFLTHVLGNKFLLRDPLKKETEDSAYEVL
jgi:hypothetical protein